MLVKSALPLENGMLQTVQQVETVKFICVKSEVKSWVESWLPLEGGLTTRSNVEERDNNRKRNNLLIAPT